jgi:cellulose synthase/poly-beta-1,6-N-acetylglucosamine synthase-like glycosyltransferase
MGPALRWGVQRLLREDGWDALVVVDADTVVDADFFTIMDSRLNAGGRALQGLYMPGEGGPGVLTDLAEASFAIQSLLRQRGRSALGGAAKLQGNGMVLARAVIDAHGWSGDGLAEDVDYWFDLLEAGERTEFEPFAVVRGEMPTTMAAARVQRARWERGRIELRKRLWPGLRRAVRKRDLVLAEALVSELVIPPIATVVLVIAATGALETIARRRPSGTAVAQLGVVSVHVLAGLAVAKAPRRVYRSLLAGPAVVGWKGWVKLSSRKGGTRAWERTPRSHPSKDR